MAISTTVSNKAIFLPAEVVKNIVPPKRWTPPVAVAPATSLLGSTTTSNAGDPLIKGARDAAKQAFLFGLKIAFNDGDREASARRFLAQTQNVPAADRASDTALQALTQVAQSIVTRTKNQPVPGYLSTYR
jgi:hypothetical protein